MLARKSLSELDGLGQRLTWVRRREQEIRSSSAVTNCYLIGDVLKPSSILTDDTQKDHTTLDPVCDTHCEFWAKAPYRMHNNLAGYSHCEY